MLSIAVAVMLAFSCSKVNPVTDSSRGTPIQIVVPNLEIIDPDVADPDTRVTWKTESTRAPKWEGTDEFQMIAYSVEKNVYKDWGDFKVTGTPNQTGTTFTGYKPNNFSNDPNDDNFGGNYFVGLVKNPSNSSYSLQYDPNNGKPRYVFFANIPAEQDGTGFKYSVIGAQYTFNGATFDKTHNNSVFFIRSALCKLTLPSGSNIKRIDITLGYSISDANQYLASSGTSQDLKFQLSDGFSSTFTFLIGGGSKTITIKNGDSNLPESPNNIYWACARTQYGASRGYAILTFKFTNDEGKVATKVIKMYRDANGNGTFEAEEKVDIAGGKALNSFGTVTFNAGDFK